MKCSCVCHHCVNGGCETSRPEECDFNHNLKRRDTVPLSIVVNNGPIHLPKRRGDAGYDLEICRDYTIWRAGVHWLKTEIKACIPDGYFGMIVGRSSLARKHGVLAVTGIIDAGYTGFLEIGVMHAGHGSVSFVKGERLAQMVILPIVHMNLALGQMPETDRGSAGWGSSG